MRIVVVLVGLLMASVSAASARAPDLSSRDTILAWINTYRAHPDPAHVPAAIRSLGQLGSLRDTEASGVFVGFLAGVLAANPERAEEIVTRILPLPDEQQWALVRAIAYSGLPDWKALLTRVSARMPRRQVMIARLIEGKLPTLAQAPIEKEQTFGEKMREQFSVAKYFVKAPQETKLLLTPDVLDTLWGFYFATGSSRPLARIIAMLRWYKERDKVELLTLGSMAKYTLAINASRNPDLLAQLKAALPGQPENIAKPLNEAIDAAETAETARLRSEALAAIEELKAKGPGYKRDVSLWGQVGEGALAVGCIALAVAGQVEFGVPCVVGGAATSAALRLWDK